MPQPNNPLPGFQGSLTSWVEVIFYQHGDDPIVVSGGGGSAKFLMNGRRPWDDSHCVISVQTSKAISGGAGQWSIQLKESQQAKRIFDALVDDDWVDLVFYKHDQPWHVMRGLVDEIRRSRTVGGSGATSTIYTISGRDFQKIWEITPVWFNPYANNDIVTEAVASQVFGALPSVVRSPPEAVEAYLFQFLESISAQAGPNWDPPPGMPGVVSGSFADSIRRDYGKYQNFPPRINFNPNFMAPSGTLWNLATQASDPMFTELYADLLPNGDCFSPKLADESPLSPDDFSMTVVVRDKPFPTTAAIYEYADWWDKVPVAVVPRQQIQSSDLGRGGLERFNTFFLGTMLLQEGLAENALTALVPLVNPTEIKRHGMRRMDVQSSMSPAFDEGASYGTLGEIQRLISRDWYALNPYYISGTITLAIGRPDIRVGCRVRIPGAVSEGEDESYYVEQVSHTYTFPHGIRTTLGVTRGWIGTDAQHADALIKAVDAYIEPQLIRDGGGG